MIAFRSEKDGGGIYLAPALGGAANLLAPLGRNPRFSPDGRWVAYSVGGDAVSNPGSAAVFIVNSGGGVPRAIHPEMATATNPVWSPRSDRLVVLGRKDGNAPARAELDWWILPIDGGSPRRTGVCPFGCAEADPDAVSASVPRRSGLARRRRRPDSLQRLPGRGANLWESPCWEPAWRSV